MIGEEEINTRFRKKEALEDNEEKNPTSLIYLDKFIMQTFSFVSLINTSKLDCRVHNLVTSNFFVKNFLNSTC